MPHDKKNFRALYFSILKTARDLCIKDGIKSKPLPTLSFHLRCDLFLPPSEILDSNIFSPHHNSSLHQRVNILVSKNSQTNY